MSRKVRNDNTNKRQVRKRWKEKENKIHTQIEGGHRLLISKRSEIKSSIYSHKFAVCLATRMNFLLRYQINGRIRVCVLFVFCFYFIFCVCVCVSIGMSLLSLDEISCLCVPM